MPITLQDFKDNISELGIHRAGMHAISRVHGITVKFYCNRLVGRSACTKECAACIKHVRDRMDATSWETCSKPYGLYTWMLKDVSAAVIEDVHAKQSKPQPNVENDDVLNTLMEMFNG